VENIFKIGDRVVLQKPTMNDDPLLHVLHHLTYKEKTYTPATVFEIIPSGYGSPSYYFTRDGDEIASLCDERFLIDLNLYDWRGIGKNLSDPRISGYHMKEFIRECSKIGASTTYMNLRSKHCVKSVGEIERRASLLAQLDFKWSPSVSQITFKDKDNWLSEFIQPKWHKLFKENT